MRLPVENTADGIRRDRESRADVECWILKEPIQVLQKQYIILHPSARFITFRAESPPLTKQCPSAHRKAAWLYTTRLGSYQKTKNRRGR